MIQIGLGAMGRDWCKTSLPPNIKDGLIEVVAAVDINPGALKVAQDCLGLRADQCYTDLRKALSENPADFCTIVVTPAHHEAVVDLALAHNLHILSEKPIADTLAASARIADKVKRAGLKMGVTMSHRFDQDKTTLRRRAAVGSYGTLGLPRLSPDSRPAEIRQLGRLPTRNTGSADDRGRRAPSRYPGRPGRRQL